MSKTKEYYWSLSIEPGYIQAAIWTIEEKLTKVVSIGPSVKWADPADLVEAADATLSSAVSNVADDEIEPTKTVFGVSSSWVSEGQIKREYLDWLRDLCSKLSLDPTGFVVLPEAIAHWMKSEEGVPLNAVVIGVGEGSLDISVFKLGNLLGSVNVIKSVSIAEDVVEGLVRFSTNDSLPSLFLVYNGKEVELEEVRQQLVKVDWTTEYKDKLKFLHTPTVEVIEPYKKMVAISLAGASEMAEVTGVSFEMSKPSAILSEIPSEVEQVPDNDLFASDEAQDFVQKLSAEDVGFVINKDIASVEDKPQEESQTREADESDNNLEVPAHSAYFKKPAAPLALVQNLIHKVKSAAPSLPSLPKKPIRRGLVVGGSQSILKNRSFEQRPLMIGIIFLLLLIFAGFAAWWFLPRADVTIYVSTRQLERRETLLADTKASNLDIERKLLPATLKEITVSGDKTAAATGAKVVGDKAKGKVQIRNGTAVGIKINAGTVLVGPNDLKFSVDSSASASAALSPSTPGTVEVDVTATSIGAEYNLAKNETFKVGNYPKSEVDAIVQSDLAGGSSREITAVSADDLKNLEAELREELLDQGKKQFENEVTEDLSIVAESVEAKVNESNFSAKVGDEAQNIKLTLSLTLTAVAVPKAQLDELAMKVLRDMVPGGFILREEQIETGFTPRGKDAEGLWQFDAHFTANLLPEIKTDEIARKISGKNPEVAKQYLSTIPGFSRANIKINPSFPGKLAVLPRVVNNISISAAAEQ